MPEDLGLRLALRRGYESRKAQDVHCVWQLVSNVVSTIG